MGKAVTAAMSQGRAQMPTAQSDSFGVAAKPAGAQSTAAARRWSAARRHYIAEQYASGRTLGNIGSELGITDERVRQLRVIHERVVRRRELQGLLDDCEPWRKVVYSMSSARERERHSRELRFDDPHGRLRGHYLLHVADDGYWLEAVLPSEQRPVDQMIARIEAENKANREAADDEWDDE